MSANTPFSRTLIAVLAGLLATGAQAHGGDVLHHHPHGAEILWGALIVAAAVGGYALARFQGRRK